MKMPTSENSTNEKSLKELIISLTLHSASCLQVRHEKQNGYRAAS
jgi:hypothetical protein